MKLLHHSLGLFFLIFSALNIVNMANTIFYGTNFVTGTVPAEGVVLSILTDLVFGIALFLLALKRFSLAATDSTALQE